MFKIKPNWNNIYINGKLFIIEIMEILIGI